MTDRADAWRVHVDDALAGLVHVERSPVVDVGSGAGSPGIPLAVARPELEFELLEATRWKCAFLRSAAERFPNVSVVCGRAEEHGRGAGRDAYGTAVARALAIPAVALEWCLPLIAVGGRLVLYAGELGAALDPVAERLGGAPPVIHEVPGTDRRRLVVVEKVAPTPPEFPRRVGVARKRPLA